MLDLGYRHVDVFSRRALQGNGLVVVLDAENLSAAVMQELTREVRQFETAFLTGVDLPGRSARLRIFTEDEELDFAGHPVLGAAAVLHTLLSDPDPEESWALAVAQRTVEVRTRGAERWVDATMDQGVPQFGPAIAGELAEAYRGALNLARGQLHPALPMQVVSTGLAAKLAAGISACTSATVRTVPATQPCGSRTMNCAPSLRVPLVSRRAMLATLQPSGEAWMVLLIGGPRSAAWLECPGLAGSPR